MEVCGRKHGIQTAHSERDAGSNADGSLGPSAERNAGKNLSGYAYFRFGRNAGVMLKKRYFFRPNCAANACGESDKLMC
ncbi:hypothetical protein TGGT1_409040 [Toxoplasma gondii GT1]|uniref:Uncharacterized protein n=1 Tax=Toxoplasma gondii (strain ATCC 50853 / GT1) TaxID=507601 RepID=S7UXA3_TOXGG|nr:hypothetical protein TGGT1_409040 [Toxoplasma gondii GT1]